MYGYETGPNGTGAKLNMHDRGFIAIVEGMAYITTSEGQYLEALGDVVWMHRIEEKRNTDFLGAHSSKQLSFWQTISEMPKGERRQWHMANDSEMVQQLRHATERIRSLIKIKSEEIPERIVLEVEGQNAYEAVKGTDIEPFIQVHNKICDIAEAMIVDPEYRDKIPKYRIAPSAQAF